MARAAKSKQARPKNRDAAKAYYRARLIDAAIEAIARHGYSGVSVSRLTQYSGLARGMVNLHFARKEQLLLAVLQHLADTYRTGWQEALRAAGADPAARLLAFVEFDVERKSYDQRQLTAWLAFRQEAVTNPLYRPLCDTREATYFRTLSEICRDLMKAGGGALDPQIPALGITYLLEGLWMDCALDIKRYRPAEGMKVCRTYLAAVFPKHFGKGA